LIACIDLFHPFKRLSLIVVLKPPPRQHLNAVYGVKYLPIATKDKRKQEKSPCIRGLFR